MLDAQTGVAAFYQPPRGQAGTMAPIRFVTLSNGTCAGALSDAVNSNMDAATTQAAPVLTTMGGEAQMLFRGSGGMGQDAPIRWSWTAAGGWVEHDSPVPNVLLPTTPMIAPNGMGLAANGAELLIAHGGYDPTSQKNLYVARYSGGAWSASEPSLSSVTNNGLTPIVAALDAGTWLIVFHGVSGSALSWTTTEGTMLGAPVVIAGIDAANDAIAITRTGGGAVLAFRTPANKLGAARYDSMTGAWAVLPGLPGDPTIEGTPAVAAGLCTHDAELVYIQGGVLKHAYLEGAIWSVSPTDVGGAMLTRAALASAR